MAEQAVTTYRALERAAASAPMGQGMARLEQVIHDKGFEHLRGMLINAMSSQPEAQKKGSVSGPASAGTGRSSRA